MTKERGLGVFLRSVAQRMFAAGDLSLFRVLGEDGIRTAATVYRVGDKAIFATGVGGEKRNDGSGQMLHFEIMRALRSRGVRWYDFGGLPTMTKAMELSVQEGFWRRVRLWRRYPSTSGGRRAGAVEVPAVASERCVKSQPASETNDPLHHFVSHSGLHGGWRDAERPQKAGAAALSLFCVMIAMMISFTCRSAAIGVGIYIGS